MKHHDSHRSPQSGLCRPVNALAVGLCLTAGLLTATAADRTWDGGGDGYSWATSAANWDGDALPAANDGLFFDGGVGLFNNNDFAAATVFSGITFKAGAGAFFMSGNEVNLAGGVTNLSANAQSITFNLNQTASRTHYTLASMTYDAAVKNNALIKRGAGAISLGSGLDNSNLRAEVYDGVLALAKTANRALGSSPIVVSETGILRIVGPGTDQIHFNQRVVVTNGGRFQVQNTFEEIGALSGSNSLTGIVENGLESTTCRLDIGGGSGHEGIYSGLIRDGAGVLNLQVYRHDNKYAFNGTHTYSGTTAINNTSGSGTTRMIMNGTHTGGGAYTVNGHNSTLDRLAAVGGSGSISASVMNFNTRGILSPGGALSADMTDSATFTDTTAILTLNSPVNLNVATSTLDAQLNGNTAGTGYDQVSIGSAGTFSNNAANLKLTLGYSPTSGDQFTIVKVEGTDSSKTMGAFGSLNGTVTDLSQGATFIEPGSGKTMRISYRAEGTTFDAGAGNGNDIMLEVVASGGANLTWRGDVNNLWDITTTANWRTSGGTATTFTNGDNVVFSDAGSNSLPVDLTTDLSPGNITVDAAKDYVLATGAAGKLTGTIVLTKTNTGTLTVLTDNDNAGSTLVKRGTVRVGTNGITGALSGALDIGPNGTVVFDRSDTPTNSSSITGSGTLVQNGTNGTLILTANSTFSGGTLVNAGTLQFGDGSGVTGALGGTVTNHATVTYSYNNAATVYNSLSGAGRVNFINTSTGSKKFLLGASPNALANGGFSGLINVGPLVCLATPDLANGTQFGVGSTVYVEDTGSVYLDRGGTYACTFYLQGAGNGSGSAGTPVTMEIEGISPPTTVSGDVFLLSSATIGGFIGTSRISGRIVDTNGTSTLTFANGRGAGTSYNLQLGSVSGPNLWADTIIDPDLSGGVVTITAMTPNAISTNSLTLGAHGNFALNGNNHSVARLQGTAPGSTILNNHATAPVVLTVGADGNPSSYSGVLVNGGAASLGLTKVGAGTLTLDGDSTCTGPVMVQEGTLALSQLYGSGTFSNAAMITIAGGATLDVTGRFLDQTLTLNNGQTLKGAGTLNGNLVAGAGSVVNPGASVGTLTVANNITLGGALLMEVNRSLSPNSDRLVSTSGTITGGGTLTVANLGPALQVGDTFQMFATGVSGIAAPAPTQDWVNGRTYTWNNNLAASGSISVASVATLAPPALGMSQAGNTLTFSWPGPFKLQAQTNSVSVGISSNWADYPGGSTSPVNVTINPANPTVFFRLILP
jgi:autotransporter-associated beta strand protein